MIRTIIEGIIAELLCDWPAGDPQPTTAERVWLETIYEKHQKRKLEPGEKKEAWHHFGESFRNITMKKKKYVPKTKFEVLFPTNSIVIFDIPDDPKNPYAYPFSFGEHCLFMGEIVQMPGHGIFVNRAGKIFWGYHTDNFRAPTEDEL